MRKASFEDLNNKSCIITGGGGVIGNTLAKGLASVGIKVAILDIEEQSALKAADEIKNEFNIDSLGVKADVLNIESMRKAFGKVKAEFGKVDFLINGAGGNSPKATTSEEFVREDTNLSETFFGLDVDGFDWVFNLNFKGTLIPSMIIAKDMVKNGQGIILNISSMNAFRPLTKIPAYSAAKASINNFTEWLSVHLAKSNIRVNAIAPGFFVTNQNRFLLFDEQTGKLTPRGEKIINGTPMGRFGEVEELIGTALYLLSEHSKFVTGIVIPVDGGFNAYSGV